MAWISAKALTKNCLFFPELHPGNIGVKEERSSSSALSLGIRDRRLFYTIP